MEKEPLDMVEISVRVIETHVDIIRSLVTDGVVDTSEPESVYTLKTTLFQIGDVCDMLEKCALSIKKYADSKRAKIIQDEALQYAVDDLEELPSPDLLTQADILEKYFGIEYDSDQSRGCYCLVLNNTI
jgi:regulator of RNase E activity RraB